MVSSICIIDADDGWVLCFDKGVDMDHVVAQYSQLCGYMGNRGVTGGLYHIVATHQKPKVGLSVVYKSFICCGDVSIITW